MQTRNCGTQSEAKQNFLLQWVPFCLPFQLMLYDWVVAFLCLMWLLFCSHFHWCFFWRKLHVDHSLLVQPWESITRVCVYLHTLLWPKINWVILMHPLSTWMVTPNSAKPKKLMEYVMMEKIWTWNLNGYLIEVKLLCYLYSTHCDFKRDVPTYDIASSLCGSCKKRLTFSSTSI